MDCCAGLIARAVAPQTGATKTQFERPVEPVAVQVAPASVLLKMPVVPPAYQVDGVRVSTAREIGVPDGRLLRGDQVRPASRVTAKWVAVLDVPLVTG